MVFPFMHLKDKKIVCLGDSITQDGRYIRIIQDYFDRYAPQRGLQFINCGLSSETASGLSEPDHPFPRPCIHTRLSDVLDTEKPDIVLFCYGMNDGIYYPFSEERFALYRNGIERLVDELANRHIPAIAMTTMPFDYKSSPEIEEIVLPEGAEKYSYMQPYIDYDSVLAKYSTYIMELEGKGSVIGCIDLHTPARRYIDQQRQIDPAYSFSDSVHPRDEGHFLMAQIIVKQLFNITLTHTPPFEQPDLYHGYVKENFYVCGREACLVLPRQFNEKRRYIWRAEFMGAFDQMDLFLLEQGFALGYCNVADMYGCPEAIEIMEQFQNEVTKRFHLYEKCILFGFSRGGLYSVNYAAAHPDKVAGIYLDAPVLDMKSWPAGLGMAACQQIEWEQCQYIYDLCGEDAASDAASPLAKLDILLKHQIPILLIAGGSDMVVPFKENGAKLMQAYLNSNAPIKVVIDSWREHHPHSITHPQDAAAFIMEFMK